VFDSRAAALYVDDKNKIEFLPSSLKLIKLLLLGGVATALIAVPAAIDGGDPGTVWQTALAKNDGGNGGGGGNAGNNGGGHADGHGSEHGRAGGPGKEKDRGHSYGHRGSNGPEAATYGSFGEFMDKVRNGAGHGRKARDDRMAGAKGHSDAAFKNHGERTRTMVELAKRLGYGARVGAHQANFGTPFENGITDLQAQLAEARAAGNPAEVERLEAELEEAIENAKPGKGPNDSWATADLDVNDDGVVDKRDLDALDEQEARPASSAKSAN
jgi:hypothetical protein